jgi:dethiobiotin synthetase
MPPTRSKPSARAASRTGTPGIFVAGTDTGVGKTLVSCGLLRLARQLGWPLVPFKPAESGCRGGHPKDAAALRAAARRTDLPLSAICPFPLRPPVAPAAAGLVLSLPALRRASRALHGPLLVESAGGLLSPYTRTLTGSDLAAALGLPVLLIARNGLGTINHTALAIGEIRRRGIPLLGLLLVTTHPGRGLAQQKNAELIEALTGVRPDGIIPHFARPSTQAITAHLDRSGIGVRLLRKAGLQ